MWSDSADQVFGIKAPIAHRYGWSTQRAKDLRCCTPGGGELPRVSWQSAVDDIPPRWQRPCRIRGRHRSTSAIMLLRGRARGGGTLFEVAERGLASERDSLRSVNEATASLWTSRACGRAAVRDRRARRGNIFGYARARAAIRDLPFLSPQRCGRSSHGGDCRAQTMSTTTKVGARGCALIVDDEPHVAELFEHCSCSGRIQPVDQRLDGLAALRRARRIWARRHRARHRPSGTRRIRSLPRIAQGDERAPIIVVSARGDEVDKIVGLEIGADDYIGKAILTARVHRAGARDSSAKPRRSHHSPAKSPRTIGEVSVNADRREVSIAGRPACGSSLASSISCGCSRGTRAMFSRAISSSKPSGVLTSKAIRAQWTCTCAGFGARSGIQRAQPRYLHTILGLGYKFTAPK